MSAALTIDGLAVSFGGFRAVDGVSMVVDPGELRVLLGANGAGKTTLMDMICGKTRSTEGRIHFHDTEITHWPEYRIARAGIGRKFQVPSVFRALTVAENLAVAAAPCPGVFANLRFGLTADTRRRIDEALELTGLQADRDRVAGTLSHGQTQWLELGLLIAQDRRLLLLDEPTAGMTAAETQRTAEILLRLKGRRTVLVVEHDMAFVRAIAERITVLHQGRVLAEGDVAAIERHPKVREAYLGSHAISAGGPAPTGVDAGVAACS